ncbi:MAG: hypothetical protein JXB26_01830 [Candidatus Aminicenantes bacterium]|nr:hypothetical protein [Candidatus Aminicenantes bacterium]
MTPHQKTAWDPNQGYQKRDREVIDYQLYRDKKTGLWLRGPEHDKLIKGKYIICLGAAQTFGCFCDKPYPVLMEEHLGIPVLNLGYGGAGPSFFLNQTGMWNQIKGAACVIIQVLSGRSESNSVFESGGLEFLRRKSDGKQMGARQAYKWLLSTSFFFRRNRIKKIIFETRSNYVKNMVALMKKIDVPKILLWFSIRQPEYKERLLTVGTLLNKFPHLVNREMVEKIKKHADVYVPCVTQRGRPQQLFSRTSGKKIKVYPGDLRKDLRGKSWSTNFYYPSPEMHEDAAKALLDVCRDYLL